MYRRLYPSRRFFYGLFSVAAAASYHRYTIHADDQASNDDKSDYQVYLNLIRSASSHRRPLQPTAYRPPLKQGMYYFAKPDTGVLRYDFALDHRHPLWSSNDIRAVRIGDGPTWTCFAIYQGIYGPDTCAFAHRYLLDDILNDVAQITFKYYPTDDNHEEVGSAIPPEEALKPLSEAVDNIICDNFAQMQKYIVDKGLEEILSSPSRSAAVSLLSRAVSGCTSFLALYDSHSSLLNVVTTGNSRAVLGRRVQSGQAGWKYQAHEIPPPTPKATSGDCSSDVNSNAFGLAMQRWNQDVQERLDREYLYKPPVVGDHKFIGSNAMEPCLHSIEIHPGDFLVAGTDALWDAFTSKEVVDLVNVWLDKGQSDASPVVALSGRQKIPQDRDRQRSTIDKQFQCADVNVATHIIKNAISQDRYSLTPGTQNTPDPQGAKYMKQRNGVGVLVIFFDDRRSPVHENLILVQSNADGSTDDQWS